MCKHIAPILNSIASDKETGLVHDIKPGDGVQSIYDEIMDPRTQVVAYSVGTTMKEVIGLNPLLYTEADALEDMVLFEHEFGVEGSAEEPSEENGAVKRGTQKELPPLQKSKGQEWESHPPQYLAFSMDLSSDDELDDLSDDELDDSSGDELDVLSYDGSEVPLEDEDPTGSDSAWESDDDEIDEGASGLDSFEIYRRFPGQKHRDRNKGIAKEFKPWVLMRQSPVYPLIRKWNLKSAKTAAPDGEEDLPKLFQTFVLREKARGNHPRRPLKALHG